MFGDNNLIEVKSNKLLYMHRLLPSCLIIKNY